MHAQKEASEIMCSTLGGGGEKYTKLDEIYAILWSNRAAERIGRATHTHTHTALPSSQHYFSISSGIHLKMGGKWLRITTHSDLATTGLLRWSNTPIYSTFDEGSASFIALVSIVLIGYQVHIAKAWPLNNENAVSANKSHKNDDFCFTLVSYKFADWLIWSILE